MRTESLALAANDIEAAVAKVKAKEVSRRSGVPYTTVRDLLDKGFANNRTLKAFDSLVSASREILHEGAQS